MQHCPVTCRFAHPAGPAPTPAPAVQPVCRYWRFGTCRYGSACRFRFVDSHTAKSAHSSWLITSKCCSLLLVSCVCLSVLLYLRVTSRRCQQGHASHFLLYSCKDPLLLQLCCPMLCRRMRTLGWAVAEAVVKQMKCLWRCVQASFAL